MRILFLCHRIPYPPDKGDKIRSWHEVEWLAARHQLDLFTLIDDEADRVHIEPLRAKVNQLVCPTLSAKSAKLRVARALVTGESLSAAHFRNQELTEAIQRSLGRQAYDLAFVFSSNMAPYLDGIHLPRALDFVDIDSAKFQAYSLSDPSWLKRRIYRIEGRRLRALEKQQAERAELTLVCSEREAAELKTFASPRRVEVVPNGTDTKYFAPDPVTTVRADTIVFTGAMDYRANVDAVTWFADEILPRIHARRPEVKFSVVGSNPTPEVQALRSRRNIEVTGRVDDVRPYVRSATVAVAPLRIARGIQNKVLEALACGTPVVATTAAVGGLGAQQGRSRLPGTQVRDTPEDFAAATLGLLADRAERDALGRAGREHVVAEYRWERRLERMEALLVEVASSAKRSNVEETVFRSPDR